MKAADTAALRWTRGAKLVDLYLTATVVYEMPVASNACRAAASAHPRSRVRERVLAAVRRTHPPARRRGRPRLGAPRRRRRTPRPPAADARLPDRRRRHPPWYGRRHIRPQGFSPLGCELIDPTQYSRPCTWSARSWCPRWQATSASAGCEEPALHLRHNQPVRGADARERGAGTVAESGVAAGGSRAAPAVSVGKGRISAGTRTGALFAEARGRMLGRPVRPPSQRSGEVGRMGRARPRCRFPAVHTAKRNASEMS